LDRFEERGFEAALYDDKSPGREPELTDEQFQEFAETLNQPPDTMNRPGHLHSLNNISSQSLMLPIPAATSSDS